MIQLNPSLYYLLLETVALLVTVLAATGGYLFWRRRQQQKALWELVSRLKNNGPQRVEALQVVLKTGGSDDAASKAQAENILKAETALYGFLIQSLLKGGGKSLLSLDTQVEALIKELAVAVPSAAPAANVAAATSAADTAKIIATIQSEQAKVYSELRATREELKQALAGAVLAGAPTETAQPQPTETIDEPAAASPKPPSAPSHDFAIEELDLSLADGLVGDDDASPQAEEEDIVDLGQLDAATEVENPTDTESTPENPPPTADQDAVATEIDTSFDSSGIAEIPDDLLFGGTEPAAHTDLPATDPAPEQNAETAPIPAAENKAEKAELAIDPDDILAQFSQPEPAAAKAQPSPTQVEMAPEPALVDEDPPSPIAPQNSRVDATAPVSEEPVNPSSAAVDELDPDAILDSLLNATPTKPQSKSAKDAEELIPSASAEKPNAGVKTDENSKSNDIVSVDSALSAFDEPLIPDSEAAPGDPESKPPATSKTKAQDKEALIAELEDLLG